jgi:hypothetical protein
MIPLVSKRVGVIKEGLVFSCLPVCLISAGAGVYILIVSIK